LSASSFIKLEGVTFGYRRERPILNNVSLDLDQGEFVALMGENGSGKSTLAKLIVGLLKPWSGGVYVEGMSTSAMSVAELASRIGYVAQNPERMLFSSTIMEEVSFALRNFGINDPLELEARVKEAIRLVDLRKPLDASPHLLSTGEKHRLAIACALAMRPRALVLDEPTTGLDYRHVKQLADLLKDLNRRGVTILLITHDMYLAAEYCGRVLLLHEGSILADGVPDEVLTRTRVMELCSLRPLQVTQLSLGLNDKGFPRLCVRTGDFVEEFLKLLELRRRLPRR
jgi:energy-coupling factor transport system ATP-binding protein